MWSLISRSYVHFLLKKDFKSHNCCHIFTLYMYVVVTVVDLARGGTLSSLVVKVNKT